MNTDVVGFSTRKRLAVAGVAPKVASVADSTLPKKPVLVVCMYRPKSAAVDADDVVICRPVMDTHHLAAPVHRQHLDSYIGALRLRVCVPASFPRKSQKFYTEITHRRLARHRHWASECGAGSNLQPRVENR